MMQLATYFLKEADFMRLFPLAALVTLGLGAIAPAQAHAQAIPEPDVKEVAKTPLRDLNIDARDVPQVLLTAERDPYAMHGLTKCDAIVSEIATLDSALGADYDISEGEENKSMSPERIGQSVIGSVIPFRGIVREVSGAAENDRALRAAYTAGMVRRGFLKGVGLNKGCAYPARPK
jgi:hypothetical protein